jgi:Tfp pilus assembly protein PilV
MLKKIYGQNGQTLIEALVALGASVLVISAITVAVVAALNNTEYSKNQNMATQYAQQGMETIRQISDSNWTLFSSYNSGSFCLDQNSTVLSPIDQSSLNCGQNFGIYSRQVDIVKNDSSNTRCQGSVLVAVTVFWGDGKCTDSNKPLCHNVSLSSCFAENKSSQLAP